MLGDLVRRSGAATMLAGLLALAAPASPARAAGPDPAQEEGCPPLIARRAPFRSPLIQPAALAGSEVRLTFVGHSTFLIETPGGLRIATDYNDYVRPPLPLDLVTMNKAHSTHYTDRPDPGIGRVVRGWSPLGAEPPRHDVTVGDLRVRNVTTNIRRWGAYGEDSGGGGTEYDANSIFVFEAAGLCIAHLGHLHHPLAASHLRKLGRIDVVLVPVDGGYTLDLDGMMDVLAALNARLVLPMHYFGQQTLDRFLARAGRDHEVELAESPTLVLSRDRLPGRPKVLVLPGR